MVAHAPRLNIDDLFAPATARGDMLPNWVDAGRTGAPAAQVLLAADVTLATTAGPISAGNLRTGDHVLTRDSGYATVTSVAQGRITDAVVIPKGTLGLQADLVVAGDAAILLVDDRFATLFGVREVLVPARVIGRPAASAIGTAIVLAQPGLVAMDTFWTDLPGQSGTSARPMLAGREAALAVGLLLQRVSKTTSIAA